VQAESATREVVLVARFSTALGAGTTAAVVRLAKVAKQRPAKEVTLMLAVNVKKEQT
jgi:hypothetical protein